MHTNKNPAGRPTKMTDTVLRKLEDAFLLGCTDEEACFAAGVGMSTLYDYQKQNPEFSDRKAQLKQNPVFLARQSVVSSLQDDPALALKYLERKKKAEFSPRHEVETEVKFNRVPPIYLDGEKLEFDIGEPVKR